MPSSLKGNHFPKIKNRLFKFIVYPNVSKLRDYYYYTEFILTVTS